MPGFRYECCDNGWARLRRVPTGGLVTDAATRHESDCLNKFRRDDALSTYERIAMKRAAAVGDGAKTIFAGMIARYSIRLNQGGSGHLFDHHAEGQHSGSLKSLSLMGDDNEWVLTWAGNTDIDRVVAAMTAPRHGVAGCTAVRHSQRTRHSSSATRPYTS